ncbi:MAG: rod shape-determining protein MreC [Brevefilum sp.]|nr:rod shape-determining protein MreC [Brevefilum sp.]MDW7754664.1 rod shape-determining protein MreC [Brevefilum sp.]
MKFLSSKNTQTIVIIVVVAGLLFLALSGYLTPLFNLSLNPLVSFQRWLSVRYLSARDFLTTPSDVVQLREQNAILDSQVTQLQTQLIEMEERLGEAQVCFALLDFGRTNPQYDYIAATVIGREISPFLQYIIIDKGTENGVRYGMPVVTQQGLVGRIDAVIARASRVKLITDSTSVVNIRLQSAALEAQLIGSLTGDLSLDMIPLDETVEPGDVVLTSGLGGNYPPNIFVGQVLSTQQRENALFQTASVQPIVNFESINAVLVIDNFEAINISPLIPEP